jgi:hypothetical protein
MLVHTVVWVLAVLMELLFSFALCYGVFYSRHLSRSNVVGLLGIVVLAMILGRLGGVRAAAL